ncbi:MAG: ferredoxin [Streptosporangiales bacterium]|nr:ferredoxin [Streptosporangiales bacterium]
MAITVDIDREVCIGSGNCVHISEGSIELDDDGVATVVDAERATIDQLRRAARSCPTAAITIDGEQ